MAITNKARENAYVALYKAVAKYVSLQGGRIIVCGGIQVQERPGEGKFNFSIAVKCAGHKPVYKQSAKPEAR